MGTQKKLSPALWMLVSIDEGHVGETDLKSLGHPPNPPMNPRAPCPQTLLGSNFGDVFTHWRAAPCSRLGRLCTGRAKNWSQVEVGVVIFALGPARVGTSSSARLRPPNSPLLPRAGSHQRSSIADRVPEGDPLKYSRPGSGAGSEDNERF